MNVKEMVSLFCCLIIALIPFELISKEHNKNATDHDPITVASWNMQWLLSPAELIQLYSSKKTKVKKWVPRRSDTDLLYMAEYLEALNSDVIAFQEVNSKNAINHLLNLMSKPKRKYQLFLSDRAQIRHQMHQFNHINQYTGFLISDKFHIIDVKDLHLTASDTAPRKQQRQMRKLRFASYVILEGKREGESNPISDDDSDNSQDRRRQQIHILNVHLKAGCNGRFLAKKISCQILKRQFDILNQWLLQRTRQRHAYLVLGDFNHNLSFPNDWGWLQLTQAIVPKPKLASRDTQPLCIVKGKKRGAFQYRFLVDHIVASPETRLQNVKQHTFSKKDVLRYQLSDHCALNASLRF